MSAQRGQVILIVEDDAVTAELERRVLTRAGLEVQTVSSVAGAIERLGSGPHGVVVLDYQLPDGDPWSVVAAARAQTPRVPVILVTAMGNEQVAADALTHGVAEYLPKTEAFWNQLPSVVERVAKIAQADARLRRRDALFRLIADGSTDLIATVDLKGVIREVSNALTDMFGYEPSEVLGRPSIELVHPDDRARVIKVFLTGADHRRITYRQLRKDGSYAWVEVNNSVVRDPSTGEPQEVIGVIRDITERKRAEDKFRALLEGSPEALVIMDHTGSIVLVNARSEQLFGYARQELLYQTVDMLLVPRLRGQRLWWNAAQAAHPATGKPGTTREISCVRKDGTEFPAELSLNWLETEGEWLVSSAIYDITQRKTIQDQELLLKLGQELPRFEDVDSLVAHVVTTIGHYLEVDACALSEIDLTRGLVTVHRDYARNKPSMTGVYPLSAYTPAIREELSVGRVVAIADTQSDPRTAGVFDERFRERGVRALASVPLMRDGVWLAAILVYVDKPREWAAREIQMLQALAERTWLWLEHVRMLRALRDSERQYRRFIESTHEGVWQIDDQALTSFVNPRMAEMLGYTVSEMLGRSLASFTDDEGRQLLGQNVDRRKAGIAESHDFKFLHKGGDPVWARLEVSPLTDEQGKYVGSLAMVADVTERKQTEQDQYFLLGLAEVLTVTSDVEVARRSAASRLGAHLAVDRCFFTEIDVISQRAIVHYEWQRSVGAPTLVGSHPLSLLGAMLHDLASGRTVSVNEAERDARTMPTYGQSSIGRGIGGIVLVPMHKEGRWVACLCLMSAAPRAWTRREISLAHATIERTSLFVERLQSIAALRDFNRDLEGRVEGRTRELQTALREKEVLLKEIHHRVKNNLQVISSMLNLQAMHLPDATARAMFAESQGRVQSIALVHESLYRSKDLSSVSFVDYLSSLVESIFHTQSAPGRHVEAVVEGDDVRLPVAAAIPCGLIVNELVTNALKHAFPSGRAGKIRVGLRRVGGENIELLVADDGIGMPVRSPADVPTTLGLDLVYTFAEQIEAKVEVSCEQGSTFRLTFRTREEPPA